MKGQIKIPQKVISHLIPAILIMVVVVLLLSLYYSYRVASESREEVRSAIDYAESLLNDDCIVEERGIFSEEKLERKEPCIKTDLTILASLIDEDGNKRVLVVPQVFPYRGVQRQFKFNFPCNIKTRDGVVKAARLEVIVWGV